MMNRGKASPDRWCNNSISGLKIEGLVIDTLKDFFLNYDKFLIEYMESGKAETGIGNIIDEIKYKIHQLEEKKKRAINFALEGIISKGELESIKKETEEGIEALNRKIVEEYDSIYNEYKKDILQLGVKSYIKQFYSYALEYFVDASYEELRPIIDTMIDKVIIPKDKKKPIRIILNVFPGEFDIDKYFYDDRETEVIREYNKQKTQLGKYQIEFSDNLSSSGAKEGGDFMFIKVLKKKFYQLFMYGGRVVLTTKQ